MKVLITGGMGVIGAEASRRFVQEGYRPVLYARHRDDNLIGDIKDQIDVETGDINDFARLLDVVKRHKITHIVHAAAFVGAVSSANPALSVNVNVMGTVNILEAARLFDIKRVVFTSAKGVYGAITGEHAFPTYKPLSEDSPKNPVRIYDAAKLMGEHLCVYYAEHMGLDTVVLRFGTTYGPGKGARHGNMGVTSRIVEEPAAGRPFRIEQGGDEKDDFIYNKDSGLAIFRAMVAENPKSRIYNIGSGIGQSLHDIADVVRSRIPGADIEIGPGLNFLKQPFSPHSVYDTSRAREELGFTPAFSLEDGIADYLETLERMKAEQQC